ncbi:MAG: RNA polymerase sigma factor [Planctomycetota bacterium]
MESSALQKHVAAAKAGRAEGYQALLAAYNPRLYGYFYRMTGNRHDAEDLLGETVLRLVRTLPDYKEQGRFEPWLFRIAANLVRDRFRRRKTAPTILSLTDDDDDDRAAALPGREPDVDARLMAAEASADLKAALDTLDPTTRNMIMLRHFAELSFAEIAEIMNCPLGTALAKVHRGLRKLRKQLAASTAAGQ